MRPAAGKPARATAWSAIPLLAAAWFVAALVSAQVQPSHTLPDPPIGNGPGEEPFRISVDVDLVVLQAAVRDRAGHAVRGLEQQNFEVFEDGAPQRIRLFRHEDTPVTVGLVIDHSGSMREKLADVTAGAQAFVHSSNPHDQMFVVNFNDAVSLGLPPGTPFSDNAEQLGGAIWRAPARGTTALYDAIAVALQRLREGTSDKKVLLVISDGGDNASQADLNRIVKMTRQSSAEIYTMGVYDADDADRNPRVLRRLARETGGEAFFPTQASEAAAVCERIARDIRDQYTIGYSSSNEKRSDAYHKIRLIAHGQGKEKLSVRTREGYATGGGGSTKPAAVR